MLEHRVVALVMPGVLMLDLAAPTHLFGHCGTGRYAFSLATVIPGPVPTSTGIELFVRDGLAALAAADTIVVPGYEGDRGGSYSGAPAAFGGHDTEPPPEVLDALRAAHARGARVMSICVGAFTLGFAGLLDGRRATTHWFETERLAERFPEAAVDGDVLYVDEGQVLTSAGVAAGLDLCLHVIRRDHGAATAAQFARRTVVAPHRDGGQAQFVARPVPEAVPAGAARLDATRAWAAEHLAEPLGVEQLARHACVSPRTFARRFRDETGTTPAQWLLDRRTDLARELLERSALPVEEVATQAGFGSAASLRDHLRRRAHTTPTAYRRAFRGDDQPG